MPLLIERMVLRQIRMPLVHFFETSFGRTYERDIVLVEVIADGVSGWGEVTAGENPFYNEEWTESAWLILRDFVAPRVLGHFEFDRRCGCECAHRRIFADTIWRGAVWKWRFGTWRPAVWASRYSDISAVVRGARFLAEFRSAFRIPWRN